MKRINYEVVERKFGKFAGQFDAVKWTEWPDRDQRIHPPIPVRLNTYPTQEAAAKACQYDADWQTIVDADAGHESEIVCDVDCQTVEDLKTILRGYAQDDDEDEE